MNSPPGTDRVGHLLDGVACEFFPSPNCDDRPENVEPDTVVIHSISLPPGEYGGDGIIDFFLNRIQASAHPYYASICHLRVSSHFLIRRDGKILQFVPVARRAWHAGDSKFKGKNAVNDFSIGIELEGMENSSFESIQYESLTVLTRLLMNTYPAITLDRIVGHSDIAAGRKTDPGPYFDWHRFREKLGIV